MIPTDRERVKHLLSQAAQMAPELRRAFIERAAGDSPQVAAEAGALLHTLDDPAFLAAPTHAGLPLREQPGTRIDRYKLLQLIGEGGLGSVFMAEQTEPVVRRVALNIIKSGMDTKQVIARFEAERQALALMDHPNIARVLDAGATAAGQPYFVMELVRGDQITSYCNREQLTVEQRLQRFRDVCGAVQHAHQKGIIHRDIKPSNVLVTVADAHPVPKMIDFGIAKATAARLTDKTLFTELHQLIGTPEYMSPEQADASAVDVDTRSDVYALGVLLYELLAGSAPFEGRRLRSVPFAEVQRIIREEEAPRPSLRLATLAASSGHVRLRTPGAAPASADSDADSSAIEIARRRRSEPQLLTRALRGDLDRIVMKCLEKDRRRRYETASALADDIGRYLAHEPVLATRPGTGYKLRKFVRRNRTLVLAGAAVAAALVIGAISTTLGFVRADREAEQARAVNEFMREVLTSADPGSRGADVRLIDVLAGASATAAQRFAGDPLQEAEVRDLLGQVYDKLSLWVEAKAEHGMAMELWRQAAGPDDPHTLFAEWKYAGASGNLEHIDDAEQVLSVLLPRMERNIGPDDPRTLGIRRSIAATHILRNQLDDAERILLELRGHPRLADDDAMQIRVLHSMIEVGFHRANTDDRAQNLAIMSQTEPLAREKLERSMRLYGPDSLMTLESQAKLADIICNQGLYAAAAETCRAIFDLSTQRLGECHHVRVRALSTLADALTRLGEEREPADLLMRRVACIRQRYGAGSPALLSALSETLRYLDRAGRAVEGEAAAGELDAALAKLGGGHGDMRFGAELYIARFTSMQDRLDEAEAMFQPLLEREDKQTSRPVRAQLHLYYGIHLARRGFFEDAQGQLETAVTWIDDIRLGTYASHPDDVIVGFIALYDAWGSRMKPRNTGGCARKSPAAGRAWPRNDWCLAEKAESRKVESRNQEGGRFRLSAFDFSAFGFHRPPRAASNLPSVGPGTGITGRRR